MKFATLLMHNTMQKLASAWPKCRFLRRVIYMSLALFTLSSCSRYYVEVYQQKVDGTYLASVHVGTPDPRLANPPYGQLLVAEWQIPLELLPKYPFLELDVIFWDNIQRRYVFPINHRKGFERLFIIDDEFVKTGGILAYRARIKTEDGKIFREWRHQLWVNLITIDNTVPPPPRSEALSNPSPDKDP